MLAAGEVVCFGLILSLGPCLQPPPDVWLSNYLIIQSPQLRIVSQVDTKVVLEVVQQLICLNVYPGEFLKVTRNIQVIDVLVNSLPLVLGCQPYKLG